mgnify:FL=1
MNFGVFADTYTFRTFKADVALTAKPVKLKYKSGALLEQPNTATVMENFFLRAGKAGATFLGIEQTGDAAKTHGWILYKKAADLR